MRGTIGIIELLLITVVIISLAAIFLPWLGDTINQSLETGEVSAIYSQFKSCSEKILETARTGTTNKCIFSISKGKIIGKTEGIEYSLVSNAPICDEHNQTLIDEQSHIYQSCNISGMSRVFTMLWMFPSEIKIEAEGLQGSEIKGDTPVGIIDFGAGPIEFKTITLLVEFEYNEKESGGTVELGRKSISTEKVIITLKIY